jgi:hypothetical protein
MRMILWCRRIPGMQKSTYAYDLFILLQKYKSHISQNDEKNRTDADFLPPGLFSILLILFIGLCLAGYSILFYYQLSVFPGYCLF